MELRVIRLAVVTLHSGYVSCWLTEAWLATQDSITEREKVLRSDKTVKFRAENVRHGPDEGHAGPVDGDQ